MLPAFSGHDDDGIFKIDIPALGVSDMAVVEDLEQDVLGRPGAFLDLVKEDDGVGLARIFSVSWPASSAARPRSRGRPMMWRRETSP